MGIIRQSIIASIYLLVTPVSSNLKMVDDRSVGIKGELDSKVKWESREENVTVLVLMKLSHGLILGADWIKTLMEFPFTHQQVLSEGFQTLPPIHQRS